MLLCRKVGLIEGWYNPKRLHSTIDYNAPVEQEPF